MAKPNKDAGFFEADIRLFESGNFADATVVCGDRTWKVHKAILSSRCAWFRAAFFGDMAEATSGEVVLYEQDADLVDILLRFIYAQDLDDPSLRNGKAAPARYVQLFRMADFFLLDVLADKVKTLLQVYLDGRLAVLDMKKVDVSKTLARVFEAIRDAYKDDSTKSLRAMLLTFLWERKDRHLEVPATIALLDEIPEVGRDVVKLSLSVDPATNQPVLEEMPRSLVVLEAVCLSRYSKLIYAAGGPLGKVKYFGLERVTTSCMLLPMQGAHSPFTPVCPTNQVVARTLARLTPHKVDVAQMASNVKSNIVSVTFDFPSENLHIRFVTPEDARHYVKAYCNAKHSIKELTSPASNLEQDLRSAYDQAMTQ